MKTQSPGGEAKEDNVKPSMIGCFYVQFVSTALCILLRFQ